MSDAQLISPMLLVTMIAAVPIPLFAWWGWRLSKRGRPTLLGLLSGVLVGATIGGWSLGLVFGQGAGFVPLPSLYCGYLAAQPVTHMGCYPPAWVMPIVMVAVFCAGAVVSWRRHGDPISKAGASESLLK